MRARPLAAILLIVACTATAAGCGSSARDATAARVTRARSTTSRAVTTIASTSTSVAATTSTTTARTVPTTVAVAPETAPPTAPAAPAAPPTVAPPPPALLVTHIAGMGGAQQAIVVATDGYGTSAATVTAYERGTSGWKQVFGPWSAYVGRNGVAPAGAKREGDGRTPSGVFGFDFMFGVNPDPGVHFPFRRVTGTNLVWDDDSSSANYNEWIDTNTATAGANPEPMYNTPSYFYGAVIAYNDARTPGLGSAIFLHVSHGSGTAGCVALPTDELLTLLRWLDPGRSPRIAIGTLASFTTS